MKKQVIILEIIVLFFCVGLNGCTEIDNNLTSIEDLNEHPNKYLGNTVTFKGIYKSYDIRLDRYTIWDSAGNYIHGFSSEDIDTSFLVKGEEYYWTGIFEQYKTDIKINLTVIKPT